MTTLLVRSVIQNELQPCFQAIFSQEWENREPIAGEIVDTLDQVLELCKDKLEQFFYRKLANLLLTSTVDCYLAAILVVGGDDHDNFRFMDDLQTAYQVEQDFSMFKELFAKYEEDLTYGGLRGKPGSQKTPLEDALEPIAALQSVLQSGQFLSAEEAIRCLFERYPDDGLAIVRCAIVFRPDGSLRPQEKKSFDKAAIEFHQRLENVKKMELGIAPPPMEEIVEDKKPKQGFFSNMFGFGGKKKSNH